MNSSPIEQVGRRATVFQRAMIVSQALMGIAVALAVNRMREAWLEVPEVLGILFPLLACAAIFDLGVAWLLPGILVRPERMRSILLDADSHAPLDTPTQRMREVGMHPLRAGMEAAFGPYVIRLALIGSVGIYGVVLSLLTLDPRYCIGFCAVASIATVAARFDPSPIEDLYRRMQLEDAWRREGLT